MGTSLYCNFDHDRFTGGGREDSAGRAYSEPEEERQPVTGLLTDFQPATGMYQSIDHLPADRDASLAVSLCAVTARR